jgi:hypothetical protein
VLINFIIFQYFMCLLPPLRIMNPTFRIHIPSTSSKYPPFLRKSDHLSEPVYGESKSKAEFRNFLRITNVPVSVAYVFSDAVIILQNSSPDTNWAEELKILKIYENRVIRMAFKKNGVLYTSTGL